MNDTFFVQVGLGDCPDFAYIVSPNAYKDFSPIPLLKDVEYHCLLIEAQASAFVKSFKFVLDNEYLIRYLDRIHFGCFAVSPVNSIYDFTFEQPHQIDFGARLVSGERGSWEHSYKVAGVTLDEVFDGILDNGDCIDGLVMDIKGVEVDVLESLSYYPRVVIVEPYIPDNREPILKWATDNNYELIDEIMSVRGDRFPVGPTLLPGLTPNLLLVRRL